MTRRARLAFAAFAAATPVAASAVTWVVDPNGPLSSIQSAIDGAQPGDLVLVLPGVYYERLSLRDRVSVAAETEGTVTVDAEAEGTALTSVGVGSNTTLSGIVFQHGSAEVGGGLYAVATDAYFSRCSFVDNGAVQGGGAYVRDGSRASFVECTFSKNSASVGGGLCLDFSAISLSSSTVSGNYARDGAGIAFSNAAEATIGYVSFYDNVASMGAIVACNLASPRFTNCTMASNTAASAMFGMRGSGSRIERCIVSFNSTPTFDCDGFNSLWVGCNILYSNASEVVCSGDQGTNLNLDPHFCNAGQNDFQLAEDSPAIGGLCGLIGAELVACPAQGVGTAVNVASWSAVKTLFRD